MDSNSINAPSRSAATRRINVLGRVADVLSILAVLPLLCTPWALYFSSSTDSTVPAAWRAWLLLMCLDIVPFLVGLVWLLHRTSPTSRSATYKGFIRLPVGTIESALAIIFFCIPIVLMRLS
jgi:hypothetical protein